jgi:hypothetical protein
VAYIRTDASPNEVLPTQCNPHPRELSTPCTPMRYAHPGTRPLTCFDRAGCY